MNKCCETFQKDKGHCCAGNRCKQLKVHVSETLLQQALNQCSIARHSLFVCCAVQNTQIALVTSLVFLAYLYFAFYFFNIRRANKMLANESYAKYKQASICHQSIYHSPCLHCASVALVLAYKGLYCCSLPVVVLRQMR